MRGHPMHDQPCVLPLRASLAGQLVEGHQWMGRPRGGHMALEEEEEEEEEEEDDDDDDDDVEDADAADAADADDNADDEEDEGSEDRGSGCRW